MPTNYINCIGTDFTYILVALFCVGFGAIYPCYICAALCCLFNYVVITKLIDKYITVPLTFSGYFSIFLRIINILATVFFIWHM